MDGEIFCSYGTSAPQGDFGFIHPYDSSGGSSNTFPIILGGSHSLIGYVVGNSATAIELFKAMVVNGSSDVNLEEMLKDETTAAQIRDVLTTDDFKEDSEFDFRDKGYLDLYSTLYKIWDAYDVVLDDYNSSRAEDTPAVKGVVAICVSGGYAVRPTWAKRTAEAVEGEDDAVDYTLTRLDFGTEAQLATWDGSKYLCDLDENGEVRDTPVVKRVYVSRCPNEPKPDAGEGD